MIHSEAARKWNNEQRKRKLRRLWWNATEDGQRWIWGMGIILGSAMLLFIAFHK